VTVVTVLSVLQGSWNLTDRAFIRFGIMFMVLTPIVMAPIHNRKVAHRWPDGTLIDGPSDDMQRENEWVRSWGSPNGHTSESEAMEYNRRRVRNRLLSRGEYLNEADTAGLSQSYLAWLVVDLEARPPSLTYDTKCRHLLGVAKNLLKSLDSAEKCGTVEMLPEQTTQQTRDKSCENKSSGQPGQCGIRQTS